MAGTNWLRKESYNMKLKMQAGARHEGLVGHDKELVFILRTIKKKKPRGWSY